MKNEKKIGLGGGEEIVTRVRKNTFKRKLSLAIHYLLVILIVLFNSPFLRNIPHSQVSTLVSTS